MPIFCGILNVCILQYTPGVVVLGLKAKLSGLRLETTGTGLKAKGPIPVV